MRENDLIIIENFLENKEEKLDELLGKSVFKINKGGTSV